MVTLNLAADSNTAQKKKKFLIPVNKSASVFRWMQIIIGMTLPGQQDLLLRRM
jgi:hypothetical protein